MKTFHLIVLLSQYQTRLSHSYWYSEQAKQTMCDYVYRHLQYKLKSQPKAC